MIETSAVHVIRAAHTAHQYGHYQVILINMFSQDVNPQHTSSHLESERLALTNALVDESNFDTVKVVFSYFKRILVNYYHKSLALNYDSKNLRTFKSFSPKCNLVRKSCETNIVYMLPLGQSIRLNL